MTPKNVKVSVLQSEFWICYIEFLIFLDFDTQVQNFDFSKIIAYKIQNFQGIQKTGTYVIQVYSNKCKQNFKAIFLFLTLQWPKNKTGKRWWCHIFEVQFVAFLIVVNNNKWHFRNPETKLHKTGLLKKNWNLT